VNFYSYLDSLPEKHADALHGACLAEPILKLLRGRNIASGNKLEQRLIHMVSRGDPRTYTHILMFFSTRKCPYLTIQLQWQNGPDFFRDTCILEHFLVDRSPSLHARLFDLTEDRHLIALRWGN
jgi:hypothetical protein